MHACAYVPCVVVTAVGREREREEGWLLTTVVTTKSAAGWSKFDPNLLHYHHALPIVGAKPAVLVHAQLEDIRHRMRLSISGSCMAQQGATTLKVRTTTHTYKKTDGWLL